jgi:spore coat polysaccharide biosynthesis predicted glycosyltransferase SpsG
MLTYLRCSAGGNEGWGNLFRLLVIRQYLVKKYRSKVILIINSNLKVKIFLEKKRINFIYLDNKKLDYEKKRLKNLKRSDLTIIEMLNPSIELQKLYLKKSKKVIVLDDILKHKYCCDLIISCQNSIKKPSISNNTSFFSGYEYFPFREEFNKYFKKKKIIKKEINKITVFLGGSSYEKINYQIARKLKTFDKTKFIFGGELNQKFKKKILMINKSFKILKLPKNIAEILHKSDLVISGGGYTKIETACVGTPQISVPVHAHQLNLLRNFSKKFNSKYISLGRLKLLDKFIRNFTFKKRCIESKNYKIFFNENGLENIFKRIRNV